MRYSNPGSSRAQASFLRRRSVLISFVDLRLGFLPEVEHYSQHGENDRQSQHGETKAGIAIWAAPRLNNRA
jgi:hypothetical protein